jgi:cyclophilin family peptidyl-prolyl cis-trans isomerase
MHPLARTLWNAFRRRSVIRRSVRPSQRSMRARLELEALELRTVPTAAALGSLTATAFVDVNGDGAFNAGDVALSTVPVTLSGPISRSATSGANGSITFGQLTAGTYQVRFNVPGYSGSGLVSNIHVGAGQNVSVAVPFEGIQSSFIDQTLFLNDSVAAPFRFIAPTVTKSIGNVSLVSGASQQIDLAANFGSADITTSQATFNITANGQNRALNVTLFDAQTPRTVANFYDYVNSGRYNSAAFTRLVTGFVLQGGGAEFSGANPNGKLTATPTFPTVANEFGMSNTKGTLAMAQRSGDVNSAQDEFFFNLVNNTQGAVAPAGNLDAQKFTVFGKVTGAADQATLATLATTPTVNESSSASAASLPGVALNNFPLNGFTTPNSPNFAKQTTAANYVLINNFTVNRPDFLTYSVVSNSNPSVATASIVNERLTVTGLSIGTSVITVQATDQFGKSAQTSFTVTVL